VNRPVHDTCRGCGFWFSADELDEETGECRECAVHAEMAKLAEEDACRPDR
jgi:hypothetical protein